MRYPAVAACQHRCFSLPLDLFSPSSFCLRLIWMLGRLCSKTERICAERGEPNANQFCADACVLIHISTLLRPSCSNLHPADLCFSRMSGDRQFNWREGVEGKLRARAKRKKERPGSAARFFCSSRRRRPVVERPAAPCQGHGGGRSLRVGAPTISVRLPYVGAAVRRGRACGGGGMRQGRSGVRSLRVRRTRQPQSGSLVSVGSCRTWQSVRWRRGAAGAQWGGTPAPGRAPVRRWRPSGRPPAPAGPASSSPSCRCLRPRPGS